jgi:hypothetical protein
VKKHARFCDRGASGGLEIVGAIAHHASRMATSPSRNKPKRAPAKEVRCEDCFFYRRALCALDEERPCPTFRPDHPDGLRPPQQLSFVFRQGRQESQLVPQPAR